MKIVLASFSLGLWVLAAGCTRESVRDGHGTAEPTAAASAADACGGCTDVVATGAAQGGCDGCSGTDAAGSVAKASSAPDGGCGGCGDAGAMAATIHTAADLTKGLILTEFTPVSTILETPDAFEGKRVLVRGIAVAVCEKRGCWIELKSEAANDRSLRVKVEDGEIVFPLTLTGHEVVAEGVVERIVTPEAAYRELLKERAEKKGEPFDPASVTGPHVTWQLKGLGARWDS